MTVPNSDTRIQYTGDNSETDFTFPFKIFAEAEMLVYEDDTLKTLTTHYTIAGVNADGGGTVTFLTAPGTDVLVTLAADYIIQRETDFTTGGDIPADALDKEFDKVVAMVRSMETRLNRAIILAVSDAKSGLTVPGVAARASAYLFFDASSDISVTASVLSDTATVSAYGETLIDDANAAAARTTLGLGDVSTKTYGTGALTTIPDVEDIQNSVVTYATTTGSANAYVLTLAVTPSAYATGQRFTCISNFANTGSATLNVNALGAKTLKKEDGATNLASGDIASGQVFECVYDGTNMQLVSSIGNTPVGIATYESSAQTITSGGTLSLTHNLGGRPGLVTCMLECVVAAAGYSVGDRVVLGPDQITKSTGNSRGAAVEINTTSIDITFGSNANAFELPNKSSGTSAALTNTDWKFRVNALR